METVVRIRPAPDDRDEYGDPLDATDSRTDLPGCLLAPRVGGPATNSREIHKHGRDGLVDGLTLYHHNPATDIRPGDQIEVRGAVYEVEGTPGVWPGAGIEVGLYRTSG